MALSRFNYVNKLRDEKGYKEGRNNWTKFPPAVPDLAWAQNQPWCHTFASWGAVVLGGRNALPVTASCTLGVAWFKARGRFTEYPVLGGLFYMGKYGGDHVGVVYAYDTDWIYTIEGNTNTNGSANGDGVYERKRPRRGAGSPYGYGAPFFEDGTISADPRWGGTKAASVARGPVQEDDVSARDVWEYQYELPSGKKVSMKDVVGYADARHDVLYGELQKVKAEHAEMKKLLSQVLAAVTKSN